MPIIEMKQSLGSFDVTVPDPRTGVQNVQVVQKRINLKEGTFQRNMLQMDLYFDDFPQEISQGRARPYEGVIEFYVTPTPLILTTQTVQLCKSAGPLASENNILFKATITPTATAATRFPQDFLATNANFPFFHDQLYLTAVFLGPSEQDADLVVRFGLTMYMSYNEKKVSSVRAAMGVISERFEMMIAQVRRNGRILLNPTELAGETMPNYLWGGIRPEYMVSGSTLSQFFLRKDGQEPEPMQSANTLRAFARSARTMVSNPDPFGRVSVPQGPIPDWFTEFLPKGVEAGAVRPQFPPRVTQDNPTLPGLGNILMV